jgi:hypothetical protein
VTRSLGALLVLVLSLLVPSAAAQAAAPEPTPVAKRALPSYDQWVADVRTALRGARPYVKQRVATAEPGERLAVNFDVDNTVLATHYDPGAPIPPIARFSRFLERQGVAMVFNTARPPAQRGFTKAQLQKAGYPVDGLCLGTPGLTIPAGKQACRDRYADRGWTLVANVGNNDTDFLGDGYERAYRLPNYGGQLG